jgi:hypothetical protein
MRSSSNSSRLSANDLRIRTLGKAVFAPNADGAKIPLKP